MTLVAALRLHDVPVLIGDFLVTVPPNTAKGMYVPTQPHGASVPHHNSRTPWSLQKKIELINDRFAVGFTGNLAPGRALMSALRARFEDGSSSIESLREFLGTLRFLDSKSTEIVGWVCAGRPVCFRWSDATPDQLSIVGSAISGSGSPHFKEEINGGVGSGTVDMTAHERAMFSGITKLGKVLSEEFRIRTTLDSAYGFGAEILVWDGARFRYPRKIVFTFWNVTIDARNALQVVPASLAAVYKNEGQFSVMQIMHLRQRSDQSGIECESTYLAAIQPLSGDVPTVDARDLEQDFEADFHFSGFNVNNPKSGIHGMLYQVSSEKFDVPGSLVPKGSLVFVDLARLGQSIPRQLLNE